MEKILRYKSKWRLKGMNCLPVTKILEVQLWSTRKTKE